MLEKISLWFSALALPLGLLFTGIWFVATPRPAFSEVENRALQAWPEVTSESFWSGELARGIELYIADHFVARDDFMELAQGVRGLFGRKIQDFQIYAVPDDAEGGIDHAEQWGVLDEDEEDDEDAPLESVRDVELAENTAISSNSLTSPPKPAATEDEDAPIENPKAAVIEKDSNSSKSKKKQTYRTTNGVLIIGNTAFQLFGGNLEAGRKYGKMLSDFKDYLDPKTRIFSMVVPTSISFDLPPEHQHRTRSEKEFIDAVYDAMDKSVYTVDAYGELEAHKGEHNYFRTDHHWTARGAYYAYRAFCKAAGLTAVPLEKMERRTKDNYVGSMYGYTHADELKNNPEIVEYFLPPGGDEAKAYEGENLETVTKCHLIRERSRGYSMFLGGDYPLMVAQTQANTGKTVLVIKNSYGNAFVPFLRSHYSKILVVDYRYYKGTLPALMKEHHVDDVVFVAVTMSTGSSFHRGKVKKLQGKKKWSAEDSSTKSNGLENEPAASDEKNVMQEVSGKSPTKSEESEPNQKSEE